MCVCVCVCVCVCAGVVGGGRGVERGMGGGGGTALRLSRMFTHAPTEHGVGYDIYAMLLLACFLTDNIRYYVLISGSAVSFHGCRSN